MSLPNYCIDHHIYYHSLILFSGDSRNGGGVDGSLVVSMEINGTAYQGVLFAQPARNGRAMS